MKKEAGKGLSSNDFTAQDKSKLESLQNYTLPTASATELGGVKVGKGLEIVSGVLNATGGGKADSVDWEDVDGKPETFPPATHTHKAADVTGLADVAKTGAYSDLTDTPTIPTDNKQLTNGAGYQTAAQVAAAVAGAAHLKRSVVSVLPDAGTADENTIFMVKLEDGEDQNSYVEYMVIEGKWEKMGTSDVDLSGYVKSEDLQAISNTEIDGIAV